MFTFTPPRTQLMREALGEVQARIVANETASDDEDNNNNNHNAPAAGPGGAAPARPTVKGNAHIRITHLPPLSDLCKPNISAIRGTDLGALIQIQVFMYFYVVPYVCLCFKCVG